MSIPVWVGTALGLAVDLGKMVAAAIEGRMADVEASRLVAVPKLRALADFLAKHEEREEADATAAVREATEEVMHEKREGI